MIPPRFAVWFVKKQEYQIYNVQRTSNHAVILKNTETERTNAFYFAVQSEGDIYSRTITVYTPRKATYTDVGIWWSGAWLCKKENSDLFAVTPIMLLSEESESKLSFLGNVGLWKSNAFHRWCERLTPAYLDAMHRNRMIFTSLVPFQQITEDAKTHTNTMPVFVAQLLLKDAIEKETCCPISMEPLQTQKSVVTSCYHIFDRSMFETWHSSHLSCPLCKQTCSFTHV